MSVRAYQWTDDEIQFIRSNYINMNAKELGKVFKVSGQLVSKKLRQLGLNRSDDTERIATDYIASIDVDSTTLQQMKDDMIRIHNIHRSTAYYSVLIRKLGMAKWNLVRGPVTDYDNRGDFVRKNQDTLHKAAICKELGITHDVLERIILNNQLMNHPLVDREYTLYRGDDYIGDGTIYELAKKTGLTPYYIRTMLYPSVQDKVGWCLIDLDEGDDDE